MSSGNCACFSLASMDFFIQIFLTWNGCILFQVRSWLENIRLKGPRCKVDHEY
jgi:hypothetical protein